MLATECSVCGFRRKYGNLSYDNQLNAYCGKAYTCNKDHPNSPENCAVRGTVIQLMGYEEARVHMMEQAEENYEKMAIRSGKKPKEVNLHRLSTGSISCRLKTDTQVDYIVHWMARLGTENTSSAILAALDFAITRDQEFAHHLTAKKVALQEVTTPAVKIKEDKPKVKTRTVDVDEGEFIL